MQESKVQYRKKQQELLECFYKEFFSWSAGNVGMWLVTGIMEFIHGMFMWFPYQAVEEMEILGLIVLFGMWGATSYISPYLQFTEKGKTTRLYDKLQYLPISLRELQNYRLKKLTIFCFRMFFVFLAGQIFFTLVCYHEITWGNIGYVIICGFLIPFVISGMAARFTK